MEYEYEIRGREIYLQRVYGSEERVEVPADLEGLPVTALAPYIFSEARREPDRAKAACGGQIREIRLPESVREIGGYAFYGCWKLERLSLYHETADIAGGAFTGCHRLRELIVHMERAQGYCLKDILSELHHELRVQLIYGAERAELLFPEYYEEAVENTPARILETHFHGAGYSYRQCFQDGILQFAEYDRLFSEAQYLDTEEFCVELALKRLRYPCGLGETAEGCYRSWLMEHRLGAADWCIAFDLQEELEYLSAFIDWRKEELETLIRKANQKNRMEMQSFLMEYKHRRFAGKKKRFEL